MPARKKISGTVTRAVERIRLDESQLEELEREFEEKRRQRRFTCHITASCVVSTVFTIVTLIPDAGIVIIIAHILVATPIVGVLMQEATDRIFKL
jgi:hypothetical protein